MNKNPHDEGELDDDFETEEETDYVEGLEAEVTLLREANSKYIHENQELKEKVAFLTVKVAKKYEPDKKLSKLQMERAKLRDRIVELEKQVASLTPPPTLEPDDDDWT